MDLLNAINHPVFRVGPNSNFPDFMSAPSTATLTTGDYNTWATANNQPLASTSPGADLLNQINANVNAARVNGVLPANFFSIPIPKNFYGTPASAFDITTLSGYKLYRSRQAYQTGFGDLYQSGQPRYIHFGLKLYF